MMETLSIEEPKLIVVITGPSGSGKTSVINQLINDHPELKKVVSTTTREMRNSEEHGKDRNFVSKKEFDRMKANGALACIKDDGKNQYGIPKKLDGEVNIIDLDPDGLEKLKDEFSSKIISIALYQSPEVCDRRMKNRGDSEEDIKRRLDYNSKRFADINKVKNLLTEDLLDIVCCPKNENIQTTANAIWKVLNIYLAEFAF